MCLGCDERLCPDCIKCMSNASYLHEYKAPKGFGVGDSSMKKVMIAFCSSQHARLGSHSSVPSLNDEVPTPTVISAHFFFLRFSRLNLFVTLVLCSTGADFSDHFR